MRLIGLLATFGLIFYLFYIWFGDEQTLDTRSNNELLDEIHMPIENAVNVKNQVEENFRTKITQ